MFLKDTSYGGKVLNKLNKVINDSGVTSMKKKAAAKKKNKRKVVKKTLKKTY